MPWFSRKLKRSSRKSTGRSRIIKKRGSSAERILIFAKRAGLTIGVIVFVGWLGVWFFMSGASTSLANWVQDKTYQLTANKGFILENIYVEGREYTDADTILAILNIEKDNPILMFDPSSARKMIEKISWVKNAKVERQLPDSIYVSIEERKPMAIWQHNKTLSLIDTEGVILTDQKLNRFKDFIILLGDDVPARAPDLFNLLSAEPEIFNKIEAAKSISSRRWDLVLKSGAVVKLPEEEVSLALSRLARMQADENIMDKNIKTIDVRELARITVRTKPGAVREYKANFQTSSSGGDAI